jgi:quercetin dioxygenase-like cupin family protein
MTDKDDAARSGAVGRRTPPRQRFAGTEHFFDLAAESQRLRAEAGEAHAGHRQITLFQDAAASIVLFDFEEGGWLSDHSADGIVTIEVLSGEVDVETADERYHMPAGSLLVLRPRVKHDVRAVSASRMLLTVRLESSDRASTA